MHWMTNGRTTVNMKADDSVKGSSVAGGENIEMHGEN